jgi:hypothetical protein
MWRLVKGWGPRSEGGRRLGPARLSDWAATTLKEGGETLVIALEVQTYLTVVFPYAEGDVFQERFSQALTDSLGAVGVEPDLILEEVSSAGPVSLSLLKDAQLREALSTTEFMCGIERSYHDDLRIVQRNLNLFPHDLKPDYVPAEAVRRLFGRPPLRPA